MQHKDQVKIKNPNRTQIKPNLANGPDEVDPSHHTHIPKQKQNKNTFAPDTQNKNKIIQCHVQSLKPCTICNCEYTLPMNDTPMYTYKHTHTHTHIYMHICNIILCNSAQWGAVEKARVSLPDWNLLLDKLGILRLPGFSAVDSNIIFQQSMLHVTDLVADWRKACSLR